MKEKANYSAVIKFKHLLAVVPVWVISCIGCYYIGFHDRLSNNQLRAKLASATEAAWGDDEERAAIASTAVVDGGNLKIVYEHVEAGREGMALKRLEFLISMHCDAFHMSWKPEYLKGDELRDAVELVGFAHDRDFFNDRGNPGYLRREEIGDWLDGARKKMSEGSVRESENF